jgi:hypothetical protein
MNTAHARWPRGLGHVSRPKYRNQAELVDGIRFASKLEAARYCELKLMQAAGVVDYFVRQPRFDLGGGVQYVADFLVVHREHCRVHGGDLGAPYTTVVVEDCKGVATPLFTTKLKLLQDRYPRLRFRLLTRKDVRG